MSAGPRYALRHLPEGRVVRVTVFWCGREFAADRVRDGAVWGWVLPVMSGQPLDWLPEALGMDADFLNRDHMTGGSSFRCA